MYNSFHWASLNWRRHASIAVVLVKNPKFLIYLSTEPTNIWKDTEMLDWMHIWSKTHIHSLPHLKHSATVTDTLSHIANEVSSWAQKKQVYLSVLLLQRKQGCLVQMSVLSLELWDYHMRRALITGARSSGVTSEEQKH